MTNTTDWYRIDNIDVLDTPALAVYPDRVNRNIHTLIQSIDDVNRLRPHVKTHKSREVAAMMLEAGIKKFKCATIAEAEMLAMAGAPDVLLAYQPVGPKAVRLAELVATYPLTHFACLIDTLPAARHLSHVFAQYQKTLPVYIDLNVGMNRTGIVPEEALALYEACQPLPNIRVIGLHAYDGHLRDTDMTIRQQQCDEGFAKVEKLQSTIREKHNVNLTIVAGGTPSFSIHAKRKVVECSPGTFIYWDAGYEGILREQHYLFAALVVTRVISRPTADTICIDLGHKAIASENPLNNRVRFLNAEGLVPTGHSEEHMTLKLPTGATFEVGDVLYGVPYHICPTVALHDKTAVIENHVYTQQWRTRARDRALTV